MPVPSDTREKISTFGQIAEGWHFGEGIAPDDKTIQLAQLLNAQLARSRFPQTDAFLGVGGQIQVNGYSNDSYLEFIIENGKISFALERNNELEIEERDLSIIDAISRIIFWGKKWAISEFFTKEILTVHEEDLPVFPFLAQALVVSQLSNLSVSIKPEEVTVNISESITQPSQVSHPFTWRSPQSTYQVTASS